MDALRGRSRPAPPPSLPVLQAPLRTISLGVLFGSVSRRLSGHLMRSNRCCTCSPVAHTRRDAALGSSIFRAPRAYRVLRQFLESAVGGILGDVIGGVAGHYFGEAVGDGINNQGVERIAESMG